jgi:hypothetical protein
LILKTTYKSHFDFKKNFLKKNKKKQIFSKSIIVFILFSKIFFINYNLNIRYTKQQILKLNLLKAPSRHKKFFHQIFLEYFCVNFNWCIDLQKKYVDIFMCINIFLKLNNIFLKIGTNTLNRNKFKLVFLNVFYKNFNKILL